ncbi:MAG: helix-turn-helix domain-containing protein [Bacteroidota bacterium]
MISIDKQLKVGRSALGWFQRDLAKRAGLSVDTIRNIEAGNGQPKQETIDKILKTFELAGFDVSEKGIQAANAITYLKGGEGFWDFLNDVYRTILQHGTRQNPVQVFLSNVVHQNWIRSIGKEKWL